MEGGYTTVSGCASDLVRRELSSFSFSSLAFRMLLPSCCPPLLLPPLLLLLLLFTSFRNSSIFS